MTNDLNSDSEVAGRGHPRSTTRRPRDFGELARRMSSRTTDLLAIGILLVGGLAVGGSLMTWWQSEPPAPVVPVAPTAPWDDPTGVDLEFGEGDWSVRRETLTGSAESAREALLERMRSAVGSSSAISLPAPNDAEIRLLEQLDQWSPQEAGASGRVYVIGGPLFWVVGTSEHRDAAGDAMLGRRVVCWGLLLPQANESWTLYVLERRRRDQSSFDLAEFRLPDGARRSMRIASDNGGELTCFSGAGRSATGCRNLTPASRTRAGRARMRGFEPPTRPRLCFNGRRSKRSKPHRSRC
jgi:hypothetical protein